MSGRLGRVTANDGSAQGVVWRIRLRHAAIAYAQHGWAVRAGARLCGDRFSCGPGCTTVGPHPVPQRWGKAATTDPAFIAALWHHTPYSVLLTTGEAFDVIDVPRHIGLAAAGLPRGPVAVSPGGRWMFLVRPGASLLPELARDFAVVLHTRGSWIPAPPMRTPAGQVRWAVAPHESGWQVPDSAPVQRALIRALPHGRRADLSTHQAA